LPGEGLDNSSPDGIIKTELSRNSISVPVELSSRPVKVEDKKRLLVSVRDIYRRKTSKTNYKRTRKGSILRLWPKHCMVGGGITFREGKTLWGEDLAQVDEARPLHPELSSYLSVPIGDIGVFQAASTQKVAFDQRDVQLAEILACHLHKEIKRIGLEDKLTEQASVSPLPDSITAGTSTRPFPKRLKKHKVRARDCFFNAGY